MTYYNFMSDEEKLAYAKRFGEWYKNQLPTVLCNGFLNKQSMVEGLELLKSWSYGKSFAEETEASSNWVRRVPVLQRIAEQIKQDISEGMIVKDKDGNEFAYIPNMQQARRRGRPTLAEQAARKKSETEEQKKSQMQAEVAEMLGVPVVTNPAPKEKNNEELAQEKEALRKEQEKIQPSLFGEDDNDNSDAEPAVERKTLQQLKPLLSETLQRDVDRVREIRQKAAGMAERAKALAESGASADEVSQYSEGAKSLTEEYEGIYDKVDKELATVYLRLMEEKKYHDAFVKAQGMTEKSLANLLLMLKPYYKKQNESFVEQVRKMIAENDPEAVAERERKAEVKKEADSIIKYLTRKDKKSTEKRLKGMTEKHARLVELIGKDQADVYLPLIEKCKEEIGK